jgi:predicted Zn-ribbon and HTH transcriptional regulator
MARRCVCGNMAEKSIAIGPNKVYLCDDCASTVLIDVAKQLKKDGIATTIKFKGTDSGIIIGRNKCTRCGNIWTQRTFEKPIICPKCKSPYWNKERIKK